MTAPTAYYSLESQVMALSKESTRGTVSVASPKYIPIDPSTRMAFKTNLIQDDNLRGIRERFSPVVGTQDGAGTIKVDAYPDLIGDFFLSLMGKDTPTTLVSGAYNHVFTWDTPTQYPSYSFHINRGISNKAYNLSVIKSIGFEQAMDNKLMLNMNTIFQNEDVSALSFSPTWVAPNPFMFYQVAFTLGGSANDNIKNFSITIDNGAKALRKLSTKPYIYDVICVDKPTIQGSFVYLFDNETERAKFIAGSSSSLIVAYIGGIIGATIYTYKIVMTMPEIHYTAFPFEDSDHILGANVTFDANYNISGTKSLQLELANSVASY